MQYIVVALIAFGLLYLVISFIHSILSLIWHHMYLISSAVIVLICLVAGGWSLAVLVALLCFGIRLIFVGLKAMMSKLRTQLQIIHLEKFEAWLDDNAAQLGQISVQTMLDNSSKSSIVPSRFMRYSYPSGNSTGVIVENFLKKSQVALESHIRNSLYEEVHNAGMISEKVVKEVLFRRYVQSTRYESLETIYTRAATALETGHKLDRPTRDKEVLHCVGVSSGTNFVSEELDDIDI
jgi:hypothetical protein